MTLDDITFFYRFKGDRLPQTKSHDPDAAHAIRGCFLRYGWSSSELLSSSTEVMEILGPYLASARPRDSGTNKRQRLDQPGASASCPDHHFSLDQFTPGSIDQATSSGIDNTVGSMPRSSSHLISFDARNWTRNLTDPATRGNLDYAFNRREFTAGRQNNQPFKCDQCLKSFKRNQDLKRHKRIHLAVKPFPCKNCQRRFPRKDALKVCSLSNLICMNWRQLFAFLKES